MEQKNKEIIEQNNKTKSDLEGIILEKGKLENQINEQKLIPIMTRNPSNNFIYNKKKRSPMKINDIKKQKMNKVVNSNNVGS